MSENDRDKLYELVEAILQSPKYRSLNRDIILTIGGQELSKNLKMKQAIKSTKTRLHKIGGAFLDYRPDFCEWQYKLDEAARAGDENALRQVCQQLMAHHSSTRERLPILPRFFAETLGDLPPLRSVIDIACGLNPLAIPWMGLVSGAEYHAFDIYEEMLKVLQRAMHIFKLHGHVHAGDMTQACPQFKVDVALALKTIPTLEQIEKGVGKRLLENINADHILVSFPTHSLCGRTKGMTAHYCDTFNSIVSGKSWTVKRFEFPGELAFRITK